MTSENLHLIHVHNKIPETPNLSLFQVRTFFRYCRSFLHCLPSSSFNRWIQLCLCPSLSLPLCLCPSASAPPCTAFIYCVVLPLVHIRHNFPSLINRMVRHFFIYLPIFHPAALLSFPETREPGTARFFQAARPVTDKDPANHRACRCLGINAYTIR